MAKRAPVPAIFKEEILGTRKQQKGGWGGRSKASEARRDEAVKRACSISWAPMIAGEDEKRRLREREADRMMMLYAEALCRYHRSHPIDWRKKLERASTLGCMMRAVIQAHLLDCKFEQYVKAQFYWINQHFSRAPTYAEMASAGALSRVKHYRALEEEGQVGGYTINPAAVGKLQLTTEDLLVPTIREYEETILRQMIQRWGSEETVWELVGDPSDESVFSNAFKQTREVWRTMFNG